MSANSASLRETLEDADLGCLNMMLVYMSSTKARGLLLGK